MLSTRFYRPTCFRLGVLAIIFAELFRGAATLVEMKRAHIRAVLDDCGWKVSGKGNAADRLGLSRSTLQFQMKKLGITRPERGA